MVGTGELFQLKNALHAQPFFARFGLRESLLKLPHQLLPFLNLRVRKIRGRLPLKGESIIHLHDHKHARSEEIDFHVLDAGVLDAFGDFAPDLLVIFTVLGYERGIVFQVEGEAIATGIRHIDLG